MGSIQQYSEPTIEDTFALSPLSKRPGERIPSFRRGNSDVHIPCSSRSRPCQDLNTTAPVHESPSSCSIEAAFLMPQIPGGIEASLVDSTIHEVADDAPGNIVVEHIVAATCPRNLSAIVGRPGERRESTFDHGNMRQPDSVKMVEICRVAPKPGSPDSATPDQLFLSLTFFDMLWLRFPPVQRLYFYELTSSSSTTDSILADLKTSLSLTLQHYAPLAGNLTWPQDSQTPILSYVRGDAVSLTVAESDADNFDHLSSNDVFLEFKAYRPLVPKLEVSHEQAAAIALQITLFPGRGFAIGTTMHHAILDGKTSSSFVKSWAHACSSKHDENGSHILLPEPLYDRTIIHDPTGLGLESTFSKEWKNLDGPNNRSVKFVNYYLFLFRKNYKNSENPGLCRR